MTGIVIIVFIWAILCITSGDNIGEGILILFFMALSAGAGLWIGWDHYKYTHKDENK